MTCGRKLGRYDCCSVVCGDCLELMKALPEGCVDAVITDPPYGIRLENHARGRERRNEEFTLRGDDNQGVGIEALSVAPNVPTMAFSSPMFPWPGEWTQYLVWDKGPAVGGGGDWQTLWKLDWELIQWRSCRHPLLGRRDSSVLRFWIGPEDAPFNPAQKPLDLLIYLVGKIDSETILDPFLGSGTTAVAAKKLGRHFLGFEISEDYCRIARERIALVEAQPNLFEAQPEQATLGDMGL